MRNPVGMLRNLFVRLYTECFDVELYDHAPGFVLFRDRSEKDEREFIFLFTDSATSIIQAFDLGDVPHNFGMMFADPNTSTTFCLVQEGVEIERSTTRRYAINVDRVQSEYRRFIQTSDTLARDALAIHEATSVALAAHEIRHELQLTGIIPKAGWYQKLPPFREQRLTATKQYSKKSSRLVFHGSLKQYGKRLIDDPESLAMELDAHAVQLASSYAWTDTRHLPLEERLKRIRDIVFSTV